MQNSRLQRYLYSKRHIDTPGPIKKSEIQENPDKHIDQDFPGYPHGQSSAKLITPQTKNQKKVAALDTKDGEKRNRSKKRELDEQQSNGSGNAFEGTEGVNE